MGCYLHTFEQNYGERPQKNDRLFLYYVCILKVLKSLQNIVLICYVLGYICQLVKYFCVLYVINFD